MKKHIYLDRFMLRKAFRSKVIGVQDLRFWTKKSQITLCFGLGRRFQMYNGYKFVNLTVERDMQGYTMGEFCITKRITSDIHVKSAKNVKKNR